MFPRLYDPRIEMTFLFLQLFNITWWTCQWIDILLFIIYYWLFESSFSFILRFEMYSKMFVCWSFVFSFVMNCIRHEFLSKSEFSMQNLFLNVIFFLSLFETGVINRIRKTFVTFLIFEAVATFSVEEVYFVSKIMFCSVLSCTGPAGSSYLSTQK